MKLTIAALAGLSLAWAGTAFAAPAASDGEGLFQARCVMCHGAGVGGAPPIDKLKVLEPAAIVDKLSNGTMAPMAAGISDANKRDIAVFLSGKGLPASGDLPEVAPSK